MADVQGSIQRQADHSKDLWWVHAFVEIVFDFINLQAFMFLSIFFLRYPQWHLGIVHLKYIVILCE